MSEPTPEVLTAAESGVIAAIGKAMDVALRAAEQRGRLAGMLACREVCDECRDVIDELIADLTPKE